MAIQHHDHGGYNFKDLTGQVFGRLTVISLTSERTKKGGTIWICRCECGKQKTIRAEYLMSAQTQSCGCLNREMVLQRNFKHGAAQRGKLTPEYWSHHGILDRTTNQNSTFYADYGGRGITVCDGWRTSFPTFLTDVGRKPGPTYSIERRDNNGHYSCGHCEQCLANGWPANCYWATKRDQANNRRSNHLLTYQGRTMNIEQWSQELGISQKTLCNRVTKLHWTDERALGTPVRAKSENR